MSDRARVIVVGGGILGVSCAYSLAKREADVILLERDALAAGASSGNAGTVAAGHPPLNRPGRVAGALKQMTDPTGPLFVAPRWDPSLWRWLTEFTRYCTQTHVERCMAVMSPLGLEAVRLFDELVENEGLACDYRKEGYFDVCLTEPALNELRDEVDLIRAYGYHPEVLDGAALRTAEPELAEDVIGGVYYPESRYLDPYEFTVGLAEAGGRLGLDVREGTEVSEVAIRGGKAVGVRTADGGVIEADAVVLATGPFSLDLAAQLGVRLPVQPGKGYHRDLPLAGGAVPKLAIACVLHETSVFCTPMSERVRLAGTMEFSGLNHELRPTRLEQLTRAAGVYFPGLGDVEPMSEWCGLRPVCVDGLPIVGPIPGVDGVVAATGHGMLGVTLGPVSGELVADWTLGGETDPNWHALSPERFV